MKKKLFAIVMSATMVMSFMPAMAFAAETPCTHVKTTAKYALVASTVENNAVTTKNVKIVDAAKADPTCTERVVTVNVCDACGEVVAPAKGVAAAKGHAWDTANPKHVDKGCQTYDEETCKTCGETRKLKVDNDTGKAHTFTRKTVSEATCTTKKIQADVCDVCGYEINKSPYGTNLGHDIADRKEVKDANGKHAGYDYSNADEYIAPTCQYGGKAVYKCKRPGCDYKKVYESTDEGLAKKAHTYSTTPVKYSDATCTELAKEGYVCTTCVEGKNPIDGTTLVKAFDEEYGLNSYGKVLGHNYVSDPVKSKNDVAPTCTLAGTSYLKCTNCGDEKIEHPAALGHDYSKERVETVAATCTTPQKIGFKCSRCDSVKDERIGNPALGHKHEISITLADCMTSTEPQIAKKCTVCGDVNAPGFGYRNLTAEEKAQYAEEIATLVAEKHAFVLKDVVDSTCSKEGYKLYKCTCGETRKEAIAKLPHTAVVETVDATCTEAGVQTTKCSVCDDVIDTVKIPALGHNFVKTDDVKEPTCTEAGHQGYKCSVCDETKVEKLAALGHTVVEDAAVAATATKTGLTAGSHCSVCNEVFEAQVVTVAKAKTPSVKAGKKSLTATAAKVTGATKYQVAYKRSGSKYTWKYATASAKNAQTIKNLVKGKKYYVKVRTISGDVVGAWSSTKAVKVK